MSLSRVTGSMLLASIVSVLMASPVSAQALRPLPVLPTPPAVTAPPSSFPDVSMMLPAKTVPDRYIVLLKDSSTVTPQQLLQRHKLEAPTVFSRVRGFAGTLTAQQLAAVRADSAVLTVEPDVIVSLYPIASSSSSRGFSMPTLSGMPRAQLTLPGFPLPNFPFPGWPFSSSSSSSRSSSSSSSSSSLTPSSSSVSSVAPSSSSVSSASSVSSVPSNSSLSSVSSSSAVSSALSSASSQASAVSVPTGIDRIDAELSPLAAINNGGPNADVDIAVIDTGVEAHADLNVFKQVNFVSGETQATDRNGHGTHVAGTIGALDNGTGVVGVAPGARIWSVRVLDANGSGYMSDIVKGVDYVAQNASQIEVANMSLGCECASAALDTAINRAVNAGVVFAVAAGNSGKNSAGFTPASNPNVITVSAIADYNGKPGSGAATTCGSYGKDDSLASFSNYGPAVDIAAPGVCITSTWMGGGLKTISGTSMATPHVAGAAALAILKYGKPVDGAGAAAIKQRLLDAAIPQASANGFTGDKDTSAEPLLNVAGF